MESIHEQCTKHEIIDITVADLKNVMFGANGKKGMKDRIVIVEMTVKGILIMNIGIIGLLIKIIFFK